MKAVTVGNEIRYRLGKQPTCRNKPLTPSLFTYRTAYCGKNTSDGCSANGAHCHCHWTDEDTDSEVSGDLLRTTKLLKGRAGSGSKTSASKAQVSSASWTEVSIPGDASSQARWEYPQERRQWSPGLVLCERATASLCSSGPCWAPPWLQREPAQNAEHEPTHQAGRTRLSLITGGHVDAPKENHAWSI